MNFDIIFKMKDSYYHGHHNKDEGIVYFYAYGGGFRKKMSYDVFETVAEVVDEIPNVYVESWIGFEFTLPLKAYINPHNRWNGWAVPVFDKSQAKVLLEQVYGDYYYAEEVKNGYVLKAGEVYDDIDEECTSFSENTTIEVGGKEIVVNGFHDGLCWDALTEKEAIAIFFLHEVKKYLTKEERDEVDRLNREKTGSVIPGEDCLPDQEKIGDANMIFHEAFLKVFPEGLLIDDKIGDDVVVYDTNTWNEAWEMAKEMGYGSV